MALYIQLNLFRKFLSPYSLQQTLRFVSQLPVREYRLSFLKHGGQGFHMILCVMAQGLEGCHFFHDMLKGGVLAL
jgi:hypothetical protein